MPTTALPGDLAQTPRMATTLNNAAPALEDAGRTIPPANHSFSLFEAPIQTEQQATDTVISSSVSGPKEILAHSTNAFSGEPNTPAPGVTPAPANPSAAASPTPVRADTPPASSAFLPTTPDTLELRQNQWGRVLGHQLSWLVNNQMQEAEIRVNPPELGPLAVRMSMHHNQTNVTFLCHDAAVREAIETAMPRLREMLDNQGITLNQAQVSDQSLARQQSGSGEQSAQHSRDGRSSPFTRPDAEASAEETEPRPRPRLSGTVDDYA